MKNKKKEKYITKLKKWDKKIDDVVANNYADLMILIDEVKTKEMAKRQNPELYEHSMSKRKSRKVKKIRFSDLTQR